MNKELSYKDICLIPQKCIVNSRTECDTKIKFGNYTFATPVYAANMKSVVDEQTCEYFASKGYFYTLHRFGVDSSTFIHRMQEKGYPTSVSMGIGKEDEVFYLKATKAIPDFATIDIANAHTDKVRDKIRHIKDKMPDTFVIAGNVCTAEAVEEIQEWGADFIKVGIAGGKVCETRNKTGFSRGMVSTILDCAKVAKIPLIADGGVEHHGDIAKAIACGATMVMAGHLFAGYEQSAGQIIEIDNKEYKEYFGSASKYNKKEVKNVEGRKMLIPLRGSMDRLLEELIEDLQSSISYSGGKDLSALRKVPFHVIN